MKRILPAFALCATLTAQQAPPDLRYTAPMSWDADWAGEPDRVYFPQWSPDLRNWVYLPTMRFGEAMHGIAGSIDGGKGFIRLAYYDDPTLTDLSSAHAADWDLDGIANLTELDVTFTDPFSSNLDADGDGLYNGWEISHGLDPNDDGTTNPDNGASGDPDHDGLTNLEEQALGTAPQNPDSDGDGITDGGEADQGTNPNDPFDKPEAEWFILTGDLDQDVEKRRTRTVTIPAGESRLILIALHSDEYPLWTADQTQFNDTLHWMVTADGETPITGTIDVNSRHGEFDEALIEGTQFQNFYPSHAEKIESFTAPPDSDLEVEIELSATNIGDGTLPSTVMVGLLPVEVAPEVLAVNSDFDEGRIDPATGYAIPDCDDIPGVDQKTGSGNTQIALNASRAHLDGLFANDEKVTDDMHQGWFGANPNQLDDNFWDGANVTIRKIDKIDDETGYQESGHVRFYAKWGGGYYGISPYDFQTLQPVNLVSAGVNLRPGEGVYGTTSTIPDEAEFYMEGVRPGKITLEWRLQKGSIDVKHEQTFKVETRKAVAEWQEDVRYQIRLQTKVKSGTEVDIALYHPGNGFRNADPDKDNVLRVVAIYDYYQQLFKEMPEKFMWAGMAKVAAAPIYAGMSDLNTWWQATAVTPPWPPFQGPGDKDLGVERFIEGLLLSGQKAIFSDMVWAHRAYQSSGIWALDYLADEFPRDTNFVAWRLLDEGILENNQTKINDANGRLLRREQEEVVQQNYDIVQTLKIRQPPAHPNINGGVMVAVDANGLANAGEWLSANSNNNPLPGGPGFRATIPGGRLDFFNDRWAWTSNAASGMLEIWAGTSTSSPSFDSGKRTSENAKTIKAAATAYSYDPIGIP